MKKRRLTELSVFAIDIDIAPTPLCCGANEMNGDCPVHVLWPSTVEFWPSEIGFYLTVAKGLYPHPHPSAWGLHRLCRILISTIGGGGHSPLVVAGSERFRWWWWPAGGVHHYPGVRRLTADRPNTSDHPADPNTTACYTLMRSLTSTNALPDINGWGSFLSHSHPHNKNNRKKAASHKTNP